MLKKEYLGDQLRLNHPLDDLSSGLIANLVNITFTAEVIHTLVKFL